MKLFGKSKPPEPEATYPLPRPEVRHLLALPLDRYCERLAHALIEVSVLVQDYTRVANEINDFAGRLPQSHRILRDEANRRFIWFSDRSANWTETFETQLRSTSPPDSRLTELHESFCGWMTTVRDSSYYAFASKMYYARGDNNRWHFFDIKCGEVQKQRFALATDLLVELDGSASSDAAFFDSLRLPDLAFSLLVLDYIVAVHQGLETLLYFPELEERFSDVSQMLNSLESPA